jgi:molybdopterin/thiamine biosynthesis adenylyltransferase
LSQERYSRQTLLREIGEEGQGRIGSSKAVVIGCGALGTHAASMLTRAGVGRILIVDRDKVELSNLQRQTLFSEPDVGEPKAAVAERLLGRVNSEIDIRSKVAEVTTANAEELVEGATVVIDATDNMEARFIVNDACVKLGIPWIYGGAVGTSGMVLAVVPSGPCLRCVFPKLPPPGHLPTCNTVGIVNTLPSVVASLEVTEALKVMMGKGTTPELIVIDVWYDDIQKIRVKKNPDCPSCGRRLYYDYDG